MHLQQNGMQQYTPIVCESQFAIYINNRAHRNYKKYVDQEVLFKSDCEHIQKLMRTKNFRTSFDYRTNIH